jgi:hypothetical protein
MRLYTPGGYDGMNGDAAGNGSPRKETRGGATRRITTENHKYVYYHTISEKNQSTHITCLPGEPYHGPVFPRIRPFY